MGQAGRLVDLASDVMTLLDEIKATAPVVSNRTLSILVTMFNFAVEDQLLAVNPIAGLRKRATEKPKDRVLSDAEMRVLWHVLDAGGDIDVDIAAALKALLLTGQRPGEVAGAMQAELVALEDERGARWEIPAARMKARRPHVVPLAPMARQLFIDAMARRQADGDRESVFASRFSTRATLARHTLSNALRRVISNLGPEGADVVRSLQGHPPTPHDFRRTVASNVAALGVAREDRLALFAHSTGDVHGAVYDKYERLRETRIALETWERHLAELLGLRSPEGAAILPLRRGQDG